MHLHCHCLVVATPTIIITRLDYLITHSHYIIIIKLLQVYTTWQQKNCKRHNQQDLTSALSPDLHKIITANADAIRAPPEFIFSPLLTATASFMGTNAFVNSNPEWQEQSILWFIIAARKGEKKTAALKRIRKPIEEISCHRNCSPHQSNHWLGHYFEQGWNAALQS